MINVFRKRRYVRGPRTWDHTVAVYLDNMEHERAKIESKGASHERLDELEKTAELFHPDCFDETLDQVFSQHGVHRVPHGVLEELRGLCLTAVCERWGLDRTRLAAKVEESN